MEGPGRNDNDRGVSMFQANIAIDSFHVGLFQEKAGI
jgi:hypothetical protein